MRALMLALTVVACAPAIAAAISCEAFLVATFMVIVPNMNYNSVVAQAMERVFTA